MQPKDRRLVTEQNLENHTESNLAPVRSNAANALTASNQATSVSLAANQKADTAITRVEHLETMAGLSPGEVTDAQTANLVEQPDTLTRRQLDALLSDKADIRQVAETDYVDMLTKMSYYESISLVKTRDASPQQFDVYLRNTSITQKVSFTSPDDYFKLSGVRMQNTVPDYSQ